jgi:hypothetical protein
MEEKTSNERYAAHSSTRQKTLNAPIPEAALDTLCYTNRQKDQY